MPGTAAWRTTLGRFWSHDYAERIVVAPDNSHVWLLTRFGSFREFSNLAAGSGLRLYQTRKPSDEFRKLYFDTATGGWQLQSLDGRTDFFRSDGLWVKTAQALDPGHPTKATYSGSQLTLVEFPDGRSDSFTYYPGGKLHEIIGVPVAGSGTPTRTWTLTWSGDLLDHVDRPDGTTWQFYYDATRPGYLTRIDLVASTGLRVMAAFSYLAGTNDVEQSWRGDPSFTGANAVDKVAYSYTNPAQPTQIVTARTVSPAFTQVTTYNLGRDTLSNKPKVLSFQGSCPTCGLSPTTTFAYAGTNPLLPSSMTDARLPVGTRTDYTYDGNGRLATKTEAANVPALTRLTSYTYDPNFPGLLTRIEVPSTSGGTNKRRTDSAYDPTTSFMTSRTIDGFEGGAAFPASIKTTVYTPNGSGEIASIDPPGFGTNDVTTFVYDLAGRNGHVVHTRTDPNPTSGNPTGTATATFGYDGFNRRTSVIDPNGVETSTAYDPLNRVLESRQKGAVSAGDLVTSYTYDDFKSLFCVKLPRGNGVEYTYDAARRLTAVTRGVAVAVPTTTSCLDPLQPRERTRYDLDGAGNRVQENRERWNGTAWVSSFTTTYDYTCHLDRTIQGAGSGTPSVTENCYDSNDNLEKVWDANHPKASYPNPTQLYVYDELNRLKSLTAGSGTAGAATTSYTYDVQDHLLTVTDAENNQTTYTTSDRDLMTQQISPVSGTTTYAYDEHGVPVTTTDARNVVTTRINDAASRVTQATFGPAGSPDTALTTTYAYGSTPAQFDVGRLTGITRNGQTLGYGYDRFGRMLQDGALGYQYDENGYRTLVTYPGGVTATFTPDFADRDSLLSYNSGSGPQPLVTAVSYRPAGPVESLTFANGIVETRGFDTRYFPSAIQAGSLLSWTYTVDGLGNPTAIAGSLVGVAYNPSFGYQDYLYFLTQGDGPWGSRGWTYDKIGNRSTFARTSDPTLSYTYAAPGHNPKLSTVTPAPGWGTGSWTYGYDAAGNQSSIVENNGEDSSYTVIYDTAADGRLSALRSSTGPSRTDFLYDGRGFLRSAHQGSTSHPSDYIDVTPIYSSNGVLMARTEARQWTSGGSDANGEDSPFAATETETTQIFYFAGRPVAQLTSGPELLYLSTDSIGTPVLATNSAGTAVWAGGLEPFGTVWTAAADNPDGSSLVARRVSKKHGGRSGGGALGASGPQSPPLSKLSAEKVFLRYPGQWSSDAFRVSGTQGDLYYNVNRWYEPQTGRYTQPDPLDSGDYVYVVDNPLRLVDPTGESPWPVWPPEEPWHPGDGIKTKCRPGDDCATIISKMGTLLRMIETHENWDWHMPRPRGGNRHARDITQLWTQFAKCQAQYFDECSDPMTRCMRRIGRGLRYMAEDMLQFLARNSPKPAPWWVAPSPWWVTVPVP